MNYQERGTMKTCRTCKTEKEEGDFYARYATCKACTLEKQKPRSNAYYAKNSQAVCERTNATYHANKDRYLGYKQEWRLKNSEHEGAIRRAWRKGNAGRMAYEAQHSSYRRAMIEQATVAWADSEKVKVIFQEAQKKGYHVDHIVPLISDKVCGLHCEDNLRAIPAHDNHVKSNKLIDDIV